MRCFAGYHVDNRCPVQLPAQETSPHELHVSCGPTLVGVSLQTPTLQGHALQPEKRSVISTRPRSSLFECISLFPFTHPTAFILKNDLKRSFKFAGVSAEEIRRGDNRESYLAHPDLNHRMNNHKNRENPYKLSVLPNQ